MASFFAALPIVAALLLIGAGIAKVFSPSSAVDGLVAVGLSAKSWMVRLGALLEALLGALNLWTASPIARVFMVLSYLAFAAYLNVARTSPQVKSCGCFGERGSPPTLRQIVVDLLVAFGVAASIATHSPTLSHLLSEDVTQGVAVLCLCALSAWLMTFVLDSPIERTS
jgi:hypothetical protein